MPSWPDRKYHLAILALVRACKDTPDEKALTALGADDFDSAVKAKGTTAACQKMSNLIKAVEEADQ